MGSSPRPVRRTPPTRPAPLRRVLLFCTVALATTGVVGGLAPAAHAAPANGPASPVAPAAQAGPVNGPVSPVAPPAKIEPFATYQPQSTCDPAAKAGTLALANLLLGYYHAGRNGGISRNCNIGTRSEHKEGRAFDWMLSVNQPQERAVAEQFIAWLLQKGPHGEAAYNARRLGVMYVIWNRRIWSADHAKKGWLRYGGPNPHVDHIHISLSWSGAKKRTSFWTGVPAYVGRSEQASSPGPDKASAPGDGGDDD